MPGNTEEGVSSCVGYSGSWREVIRACMEGMIFTLGPEGGPAEKRITEEKLVSRGAEL